MWATIGLFYSKIEVAWNSINDFYLFQSPDVEILYHIIKRAEQKPDVERHPFRAIFAAYDAVLLENDIQADKDQKYLRFLFQLGDKRKRWRGQNLYARFEALLLRMGIQLEEGDGPEENGQFFPNVDDYTERHERSDKENPQLNGDFRPSVRQRRASFNSMYDAANEFTQRSIYRPSSRSSLSRLHTGARASSVSPSRRFERAPILNRRRSISRDGGNRLVPDERLNAISNWMEASAQPIRSSNWTAAPELDEAPNGHYKVNGGDTIPGSYEESVVPIESFSSDDDHGVPTREPPVELVYRPTLPHLLRDASMFNTYRQQGALRQLFAQWAERSKRQQAICRDMEQVAIRRDRNTLFRQAYDIWRGKLYAKRQEAQTERFFKHLENRASRARDLYLLTKAFTHWVQITSEEVERTSAARRHILCVKYFNAWREITAVNELKIQRLTLKRPFKAWRAKLAQLRRNGDNAVTVYRANLTKNAYWGWFWSFCDQRAPLWRDYHLKRRSLICWLRALRTQRERDHEIDSNNKHVVLQSALQKWAQRSRTVTVAQYQADANWKSKSVSHSMSDWRVQSRLQPIATKVSNMVDRRIVRTAGNFWSLRTRMERQSREIDRLRVMRNAWIAWNDQLRCKALSERINERIAMQALYKWVLMERCSLMTRIRQQRLKDEMLYRLMMNSRGLYTTLLQQEEDFRATRKRELLRSKFDLWKKQLGLQRQREHVALEFYAPRVEHESLDIWRTRVEHLTKLEDWADDARYYFLITRSIKKWHAESLISSKRRRQEAYATVRRRLKKNSAAEALLIWRSKYAEISDLEQQADDVYTNKLFRTATYVFDVWNKRSADRIQNIRDSEVYYNRQQAYSYLTRVVGSLSRVRSLEEKASQFSDIRGTGIATAQLRKLSLRVFQIGKSLETADALNGRNLRKHIRNMFRHWLEKARASQDSGDGRRSDLSFANDEVHDTESTDEWPLVDSTLRISDLGPILTPTPTPGYLSSPSKRAARARALAHMSTTPATPKRTPFAARLMAQASTEPRHIPGKKSIKRRSSLGTNVRFADDEEQPHTPAGAKTMGHLG